jgi:hypothetical protein
VSLGILGTPLFSMFGLAGPCCSSEAVLGTAFAENRPVRSGGRRRRGFVSDGGGQGRSRFRRLSALFSMYCALQGHAAPLRPF